MNCYDKEGKKLNILQDAWNVWDNKEYTYGEVQNKLNQLKHSDSLNNVLDGCTICSVCNSTCNNYFEIIFTGYNADLGHKQHRLMICPLGVKDIENCPLSK